MERSILWVKDAEKEFRKFPAAVQQRIRLALAVAGLGETADIAKPMKGLGSGVYEIALAYRTDAYRAVYAVKLGPNLYVVHAFQKKSKRGIKTPKEDVDLIKRRLKQIKEKLK